MSIGKKSIARAATAAAKADAVAEETATTPVKEPVPTAKAVKPQKAEPAEKFKKVSVGDKMPLFLL